MIIAEYGIIAIIRLIGPIEFESEQKSRHVFYEMLMPKSQLLTNGD